jgi:flagellar biosynthetic protein FliP
VDPCRGGSGTCQVPSAGGTGDVRLPSQEPSALFMGRCRIYNAGRRELKMSLVPRRIGKFGRSGTLVLGLFVLASAGCTVATPQGRITVDAGPGSPQELSSGVQLLLLLTALALAPAFITLMTSFTRIVVVLSFVRSAIGVPQLPPNQVILGLSLFLTVFVMAPVWGQVNNTALQPYLRGEISQEEAFRRGEIPLRQFMFRQTREKDLSLFVFLAKMERPRTPDDVPTYVLVPAFVISELKTAFQMGFVLFIPFLIIDLVVSSALMSMGMLMLPPVMISLPFKVMLFVLVDGWHLVVRSLVASFG